jgi:peptidoglycan/LPS O-acetylase OafA/YrhL
MSERVRIDMMDGLRGWAALSVAGFHFVWETFGARFPELRTPITAFFLNGPFAVAIFFVLSGYVLTVHDWLNPDKTRTVRQLCKRYTRLMLPVLAASAIVLLLMSLRLTPNAEAGRIVGRPDWLGGFLWFTPSFGGMLEFATAGVFLNERSLSYGPFLWTMTLELWGSVTVLLLCLAERWLWRPPLALAALAVLCLFTIPLLSGFFFGALIAYAHRDGGLAFRREGGRRALIGAAVAAGALLLASMAIWDSGPLAGHALARLVVYGVAAPVLVVAVSGSAWTARLLSTPFSRWLGRISFPLYLMHFPVLVSVTSGAIIATDGAGVLNLPVALLIAFGSLGLSLVVATAFLPVETATAWVGRRIERLVRPRAAVAGPATVEAV